MTMNLNKLTSIATLAILLSMSPAFAELGHEGANGGNFATQEVARLSGELVQVIRSAPAIFPDVSVDDLEKAVAKTKLYLVATIIVDGKELDGQNDGQETIWINERRWTLTTDHNLRIALLFHEYLGILHLESNTYQISSRLLNPLYDLNEFKTLHCPDIAYNYTGYYLKIRYDRLTDRFLIQYIGMDEASVAEACKKFPGTTEECVKTWNLHGDFVSRWLKYEFPNANNVVERKGTKITFQNGSTPSPGTSYWTDLLFHSDGSMTFLNVYGSTKVCTPVIAK